MPPGASCCCLSPQPHTSFSSHQHCYHRASLQVCFIQLQDTVESHVRNKKENEPKHSRETTTRHLSKDYELGGWRGCYLKSWGHQTWRHKEKEKTSELLMTGGVAKPSIPVRACAQLLSGTTCLTWDVQPTMITLMNWIQWILISLRNTDRVKVWCPEFSKKILISGKMKLIKSRM